MDQFGAGGISHSTNEMEEVTKAQMRNPSVVSVAKPQVMERVWGFAARVDETVTVEEYMYWAKIEREMEADEQKQFNAEVGKYPFIALLKGKMSKEGRAKQKAEKEERERALRVVVEAGAEGKAYPTSGNEKSLTSNTPPMEEEDHTHGGLKVSDAEWRTAARAMRTASWGQMFFLITTDILGWSGAP